MIATTTGRNCGLKPRVEGEFQQQWKEHNHHTADVVGVRAAELMNEIRETAKSSNATPKVILSNCLATASQSAVAQLPRVLHLKRTINRVRAKGSNYPKMPLHRRDIVLPESFQRTKMGDKFLLYDSGTEDDDRIFIFGTAHALTVLASCQHWFVDGTFKVVPKLFHQLYTIHGLDGNATFPLLIHSSTRRDGTHVQKNVERSETLLVAFWKTEKAYLLVVSSG